MTPLAPPFGHPRSGKRGQVPRNPILGTVTDFTITAGNGQVVAEWTPVVGATGYKIQYKLASEPTVWTDWDTEPVPYYSTPPAIAGLTNDLEYDGRVIANDGFSTTTSNEDSATPATAAASLVVTDFAIFDQTQSTSLTYDFTQCDDGTGNPAKYAVRIRTPTISTGTWGDAFDSEIIIDTALAIGVNKTVQFTGLTAGTAYQAMLVPFRGGPPAEEFGEFTAAVGGTTSGTAALGTIDDLQAFPANGAVLLTWSLVANATSYQPRFNPNGAGYEDFGSPLSGSTEEVTVTGLTNDDPHDFIVVAGDGTSTTNSNEASATPTASSGEYPNEPAGMTPITERPFNALAASGDGAGAGTWTVDFDGNPESIVSSGYSGTAPKSPNNALQFEFPEGAGGGGPMNNVGSFHHTSYDVVYVYLAWQIDPNWQGHNSGVNKQFFVKTTNPETGAGNQTIFDANGIDSNSLKIRITGQRHAIAASPTYDANVGSGTLTRGQWYELEFVFTANTPGVRDGRLEVWKNGTKTHDYNNFGPLLASEGPGFNGMLFSMIWGGTGDVIAATQHIWFDHLYVSGKN